MRKLLITATVLATIFTGAASAQPRSDTDTKYRVSAGDLLGTYYKGSGPEEELWVNQMTITAYWSLKAYNTKLGKNASPKHGEGPNISLLFCPPVKTPTPNQLLTLLKDGVNPEGPIRASVDLPFEEALLEVLVKKYPCRK